MKSFNCRRLFYCLIGLFILADLASAGSKYSQKANEQSEQVDGVDVGDKPLFRINKLNLLYDKAKKRIAGQKLKNLATDLKSQDKDEINLKKLKSTGQDKDGLKEAELRRRLNMILTKYDLMEHADVMDSNKILDDEIIEKQLFKDKKLDKLWRKAERLQFNEEQLGILKDEFKHHQEKLEQYHQLVNEIETREELRKLKGENWVNSVEKTIESAEIRQLGGMKNSQKALKAKHKEIKENYDKLRSIVSEGPARHFEEEKVEVLWEMAQKADFTRDELDSLKEELQHYENRIKKLKYFEDQLSEDRGAGKYQSQNTDDIHEQNSVKKKVKELNWKVEKIHRDIETRITQRHIEL